MNYTVGFAAAPPLSLAECADQTWTEAEMLKTEHFRPDEFNFHPPNCYGSLRLA